MEDKVRCCAASMVGEESPRGGGPMVHRVPARTGTTQHVPARPSTYQRAPQPPLAPPPPGILGLSPWDLMNVSRIWLPRSHVAAGGPSWLPERDPMDLGDRFSLILSPSRLQNRCSRVHESLIFIKSTCLHFHPKSTPKLTPRMPHMLS